MKAEVREEFLTLLEKHELQPFYGSWDSLVDSIYEINKSLKETFWYFFPDLEKEGPEVVEFYEKYVAPKQVMVNIDFLGNFNLKSSFESILNSFNLMPRLA